MSLKRRLMSVLIAHHCRMCLSSMTTNYCGVHENGQQQFVFNMFLFCIDIMAVGDDDDDVDYVVVFAALAHAAGFTGHDRSSS